MKTKDKQRAEVIDLGRQKQKRLVLDAFDRLERHQERESSEKRAEVERKARKQL